MNENAVSKIVQSETIIKAVNEQQAGAAIGLAFSLFAFGALTIAKIGLTQLNNRTDSTNPGK